jgi:hypothetical protein
MSIHPVFHVSRLKPYRSNDENEWPGRIIESEIRPAAELLNDGEQAWEVERILKKRTRRFGRGQRIEYLVKWKGYPDYEASWEPSSNLREAPEAIQSFESRSATWCRQLQRFWN